MARIPPTPSTVKKLFSLSGNNCANPNCNNFLVKQDVDGKSFKKHRVITSNHYKT